MSASLGRGKSGGKKKRGGDLPGVEGGVSWAGRAGDVISKGVEAIRGSGVEIGVRMGGTGDARLVEGMSDGVGGVPSEDIRGGGVQ